MRSHFTNNVVKFSLVATKHLVKQMQLVEALLLEEMHNTILFLADIVCPIRDQRLDTDADHLVLSLDLEPEVSVLLFSQHRPVHLSEVGVAAKIRVPSPCEVLECCPGELKEWCLKLGHVVVKIGCAFPVEAAKLPYGLLRAFLAQVYVDADGGLEGVTIDRLHVAVTINLIFYCALKFCFQVDNDPVFELDLALFTKLVEEAALHEVDVKVVEEAVEQHGKDGKFVPLGHELEQKALAKFPVQTWLYLFSEIVRHNF